MAYVKRIPIKTTLGKSLKYITNEEKSDGGILVTGVNCSINPKVAYKQMDGIKKNFDKEDGILGFHFVQSFKPGELEKPEKAHEIGLEWADKFLKNHQYILTTHVDKDHIHNHIVINSVGLDGRKYNSCKKELQDIRDISDKVCEEHKLNIIEVKGKGKQYKEWKEEKEGKETWKSIIKKDIDNAIKESNSFEDFMKLLKENGYLIKHGNIKYMTFKKEGMGRAIRGKTLGEDYSEESIKQRIKLREYDLKTYQIKKKPSYKTRNTINLNKYKYRKATLSTNIEMTMLLMKLIMTKNKKILEPRRYNTVKKYNDAIIKKLSNQLIFVNENNINTKIDIAKAKADIQSKINEANEVIVKMNDLKSKMDLIMDSIEKVKKYKKYKDEYDKAILKPIVKRKYEKELEIFNNSKDKLDKFGLKNDDDFEIFIDKYQNHIKKVNEINQRVNEIEEKKRSYLELERSIEKIKNRSYIENIKTKEKENKIKEKNKVER